MNYDRIQEAFRFITPGLYFLALLLIANLYKFRNDTDYVNTIEKLSSVIIVLLPFVGFVVGFMIESIMTWIERCLYWIGISRPSRKVLHGNSERYVLDERIRDAILKGEKVNDNKRANYFQQVAKQHIGNNELVSRFYHHSIMARHIVGAQLLASVYYFAFGGEWIWWHFFIALSILVLLSIFWYHQNCVYMKYLFAEYGKQLLAKG